MAWKCPMCDKGSGKYAQICQGCLDALRASLAEKEAALCRARDAGERMVWCDVMNELRSSSPCPHAERVKVLEKAIQFIDDHVSTEDADKFRYPAQPLPSPPERED